MLNNSFLVIFFRVVNLAALAGLGFYLFKKYVKAKIDEKITQKEALLKGLEEQGYFLEGKAQDLDDQLRFQEKKIALLKQKIEEWDMQIAAENNKRAEEYKLYAARATEQVLVKNENIARQQWRRQVAPHAIAEAEQALVATFSDQSRGKNYVHDIVHRLKRS
jgi:peptidoglycan hydrolase CwlO-like protein